VAEPPVRHWHFTAQDLLRMVETGIIHEHARIDLPDGELFEMPDIGDWRLSSVDVLNAIFTVALNGRAIVRVEGSLHLSPDSEPQPDLLVLRYRADFYRNGGAGPSDVLLAIEVTDTSTAYDRERKLPLYGRRHPRGLAGGARDLPLRFEVYRQPDRDAYRSLTCIERDGAVSPAAFPDLTNRVQDVIG